MTKTQNKKQYDLEERTAKFAESCRNFVKRIGKNTANNEYRKQLIRSSGSQAANYIEANESSTKKEFLYRIRVCRKEAKESCLWLRLCDCDNEENKKRDELIGEAKELRNIFTAIISKTE